MQKSYAFATAQLDAIGYSQFTSCAFLCNVFRKGRYITIIPEAPTAGVQGTFINKPYL